MVQYCHSFCLYFHEDELRLSGTRTKEARQLNPADASMEACTKPAAASAQASTATRLSYSLTCTGPDDTLGKRTHVLSEHLPPSCSHPTSARTNCYTTVRVFDGQHMILHAYSCTTIIIEKFECQLKSRSQLALTRTELEVFCMPGIGPDMEERTPEVAVLPALLGALF